MLPMLALLSFVIEETLMQKLNTKIKAESHFKILKVHTGRPPNPGEPDT